ncbi:YlxQ family RNA-binding protein [Risungbinella massiliensis]|uniref:YlxQ family RNA-binding protein n=1 Tax=Risungbinella massiliensis TaxID=1329796 RepID=UPI00227961D1|nr:YlxQ family RNA-binding protein [Risungbinella massiliensis]
MKDNFLQKLGLAMRAGKVVTGEELVIREIRSGRAELVILSLDASRNTAKKIMDKCQSYQVPILRYGSRQELGLAVGKAERVVLGIADAGFARMLKSSRSE